MQQTSWIFCSIFLVFHSMVALEIPYPAAPQVDLGFELEIRAATIEGIATEALVLQDASGSEAFTIDDLPSGLFAQNTGVSSLSLRGRFPDTIFFDWLCFSRTSVLQTLDVESVRTYAIGLEELYARLEGWELKVLNSAEDYHYYYGTVLVEPPNAPAYELPNKPRDRPLGSAQYFIVDYRINEVLGPDDEALVPARVYYFRDYLLHHNNFLFVFRVGIRSETPKRNYFESVDRWIRGITVGDVTDGLKSV